MHVWEVEAIKHMLWFLHWHEDNASQDCQNDHVSDVTSCWDITWITTWTQFISFIHVLLWWTWPALQFRPIFVSWNVITVQGFYVLIIHPLGGLGLEELKNVWLPLCNVFQCVPCHSPVYWWDKLQQMHVPSPFSMLLLLLLCAHLLQIRPQVMVGYWLSKWTHTFTQISFKILLHALGHSLCLLLFSWA